MSQLHRLNLVKLLFIKMQSITTVWKINNIKKGNWMLYQGLFKKTLFSFITLILMQWALPTLAAVTSPNVDTEVTFKSVGR